MTSRSGATVPNDGVSGVAVDIVKVKNGISVYVNGVRTVRLTGLRGAATSAPRYLAAGVVRYNAPRERKPADSSAHAGLSDQQHHASDLGGFLARPCFGSGARPRNEARSCSSRHRRQRSAATASPVAPSAPTRERGQTPLQRSRTRGNAATPRVSALAIDGATRTRYTLTSDDAGAFIRVRVTATSATSTATAMSAAVGPVAPAAPVAIAAPVISGDSVVGSTLTASSGTWSDPAAALSYSWRRCDDTGNCTPIDGATATTYTLTSGDVGSSIRIRVTAANAGGQNTATSSATAQVGPAPTPAPSDTTLPSISGDAIVGSTLTADPGSWTDPSAAFSYAWQRCDASGACTTIDGATNATYTPTGDDLGDTIIVSVTAANAGGQNTATSVATAQVGPAPPRAERHDPAEHQR